MKKLENSVRMRAKPQAESEGDAQIDEQEQEQEQDLKATSPKWTYLLMALFTGVTMRILQFIIDDREVSYTQITDHALDSLSPIQHFFASIPHIVSKSV